MKRPAKTILFCTIFVSAMIFLIRCTKTNNNSTNGTSHLELRLTDGPGPYDKVNIDIQKIEVNVSADTSTENGWQDIHILKPGVYNLLRLRNGKDTLLASVDLPAGKISQIRMILGNNNSVEAGGQTFPLVTPSAQESGLKFNVDADLTAGILYKLWIDFDGDRSIVVTGNNKYLLKPVIRTFTDAVSGAIHGIVLPTAAESKVWAVMNADSLLAMPDTTGYYSFMGVPAGNWNLSFIPTDATYMDTTISVSVSTGMVTDAGTITLHK